MQYKMSTNYCRKCCEVCEMTLLNADQHRICDHRSLT